MDGDIFFCFLKKMHCFRHVSGRKASAGAELHMVLKVMPVRIMLCVVMMAMMMINPASCADAARNALKLWGLEVVPSLFPYMVLCRLLAEQMKKSFLPAPALIAVLGLLGGSPSGAAMLSGYGERLNRRQVYALCALTGTISPMFLRGTCAAWLKETGISGEMLLCAHLAGAALSAAAVYLFTGESGPLSSRQSSNHEEDAIGQSIKAVFRVGGCIVFFSVAAELTASIPFMGETASALFHSMLEVSGGLKDISLLRIPLPQKAAVMAAASGFSGISILSQNLVFLKPLGIRMKTIVCFALLRSFICGCAMLFLLAFSVQ